MGGKHSMKNTKEALRLGFAGYEAYLKVTEDGKLGFDDIPHVVAVSPYIKEAIDDGDLIPSELGEVDAEDGRDLLAFAATHLPGLVEAKLVIIINSILKGVTGFLEAYAHIKNENVKIVFPMPVIKA